MIYSGKPSGTLKKGLIDFSLSLEFSFVNLCKNGTVWYFLHLVQFRLDFIMEASTMNPDQTAPKRAVWSGSILVAIYWLTESEEIGTK